MGKWLKENFWYFVGGGVTSLFIFCLCVVVFGDRFFGIYSKLGLDIYFENPTGVFADCRKGGHANNKFCDPNARQRTAPAETSWKGVRGGSKGGPAFSLTN